MTVFEGPADVPMEAATEQLVVFTLGDETYGMDIHRVREIIRVPVITRVPRTPDFIEGVINLRGGVIPVIDLRKRFRLPPPAEDELEDGGRIVVVEMGDWTVGMIVDGVSEVLRVSTADMEEPSPYIINTDTRYITSVIKSDQRLVVLLDLDEVLLAQEKEQMAAVTQQEALAD